MTQEEARQILKRTFQAGEDMFDEIVNGDILKNEYLKTIKASWTDMIKYTRSKSMKEYFKDQLKELLDALTGKDVTPHNEYGQIPEPKKNDFSGKLLKFMKKNYDKDNLKPDETYENIVKRMIDAI